MFAQFIYFIIVLIIYSSYVPSEDIVFDPLNAFISFILLVGLFAGFTWVRFRRLEKQIALNDDSRYMNTFDTIMLHQSIMAIVAFTINIYYQNLPLLFRHSAIFIYFPTLQALLFIGIFIGYLTIIWAFGFRVQQMISRTDITCRSYIVSNISFCIPVLIPWSVLSLISDFIYWLPFESPKYLLSSVYGQLIYFMTFLFIISVLGPELIRKFWKCKSLDDDYYRGRIEDMCAIANIRYNDILLWPIFGGKMITAGVLGLVGRFRYILVTPAMLQYLDPFEVDAVISHEIGHVKHKHLLFYMFFLFLFAGCMFIILPLIGVAKLAIIYSPVFAMLKKIIGLDQHFVTAIVEGILLITIAVLYFRFLFGYFMRNFERQADIYVYETMHDAKPLIATFEKILLSSGQEADRPNWHHFSIKERVAYLKTCEQNRSYIGKHHTKVRNSMIAFFSIATMLIALSFSAGMTDGMKTIEHRLIGKIERDLQKAPDSDGYTTLGDIYYQVRAYDAAIRAYQNALKVNPDNSNAQNNIAWLYATCEDKAYQNHPKALFHAKIAVSLKEEPHILDTLAESYFVNGMVKEAIETGKYALEMVEGELRESGMNRNADKKYYVNQLKKYVAAERKRQNKL